MIGQHIWLIGGTTVGAAVNLTGTGTIMTWPILEKCRLLQWGVIMASTATVTASVLTLTRVRLGTSTTLILPLTIPITTSTIGKVYYTEPGGLSTPADYTYYPGDRLLCVQGTASTAGTGYPYIVVEPIPERPANISNMVDGTT